MTIFFTADTHFLHANIVKYCERPFEDIHIHDAMLAHYWNETVTNDDIVYHLGDFGFGSRKQLTNIIEHLNGMIYLLLGNHDKKKSKMPSEDPDKFIVLGHYHELKIPDSEISEHHVQRIVLCHYAFEVWNKRHWGAWHLHGHSHGNLASRDDQARLDVGVDVHNYRPISYDEVKLAMTRKVFKPVDHHTPNRM